MAYIRVRDIKLYDQLNSLEVRHGCVGKLRYTSKRSANGALRVIVNRGQHQPEKGTLQAYKCRPCRSWHLGHSKNRYPRRESES